MEAKEERLAPNARTGLVRALVTGLCAPPHPPGAIVCPCNEPRGKAVPPTVSGRTRKHLVRATGALLFVLACFGAWVLVQAGTPPPDPAPDTSSIARAWNRTIGQLGIEPVFPPEEDVHVGDIYAVITRGDVAFLGRAIKLTHVDMSAALAATYSKLPTFPNTAKRPNHDEDFWEQTPSEGDLFKSGPRRTLSLVAFPGFSVRRARDAEAGVTTGGGWIAGLFGAGRNSQEVEEVRIPAAETYGVGALLAAGQLAAFCEGPMSGVCTEAGARNVLSMQVGDDIWKPEVDADTGQPTGRYAMGVEVALINRVYLTRSIVHLRGSNDARGTAAGIAARLNDALDRSPTAPTTSGEARADARRGATDPDRAALHAALEDQRERIKAIAADLSATLPGGVVSVAAVDSKQVALKQTFPRPVAIGFRAVRWMPQPSPPVSRDRTVGLLP